MFIIVTYQRYGFGLYKSTDSMKEKGD